jgi:hypothetical protein
MKQERRRVPQGTKPSNLELEQGKDVLTIHELLARKEKPVQARVDALNRASRYLDLAYEKGPLNPEYSNANLPRIWYYAGMAYDFLGVPDDAWLCFKEAETNKNLDPNGKNQELYSLHAVKYVQEHLGGQVPPFKDLLRDPNGLPGIRGRPALKFVDVAPDMPEAMAHQGAAVGKAVTTPPALTVVLLKGRRFLVQGKLNDALNEFYTIGVDEFEVLDDRHKYAFANCFSRALFEAAASAGKPKEKTDLIGIARDFGDFMANRPGEGKEAKILKAQGHHIQAVAYGYSEMYGASVTEAEEAYKLSVGANRLHAVAAGQLALSLRKQAEERLGIQLKYRIGGLYKESTRLFGNNAVLWNNLVVFEHLYGAKAEAGEHIARAVAEADKTPQQGGLYYSLREKQTILANHSLLTGEPQRTASPSSENAEVAEPLLPERLVIDKGSKPAPPAGEVRRAPAAAPPAEGVTAGTDEIRFEALGQTSTLAPPGNLVEIIQAVGDSDVELHVTPERLAEYTVVRAELMSDRFGRGLLSTEYDTHLTEDGERWLKNLAVGVWYSQQAKKMEGRAAASGSSRYRRTSENAAVECWMKAGKQFQLLCEDGRLTDEAGLHWRLGEALMGSGQHKRAMAVLRLTEDAIKTRYGDSLRNPEETSFDVHDARIDYAETMSRMAQLCVRAPQKPSFRIGKLAQTKPVAEAYKKLNEARDTLKIAFGKNAIYPPGYYEAEAEVTLADKHMARDLKALAAVAGPPWEAVRWVVNTPLGGHLRAKPTRGIARRYEMCVEAILLDAAASSQMKYGLVPEGLEDKIRAFHSKDWVGAEDRLRRMMVSRGLLKAGFNLASLPPGEDILPPDLHQGGRVDFRYYAEAAAERALEEYERDGRRWLKGRSERHRKTHEVEALASIRILETLGEKELAERLKQKLE